MLLLFTFVKSKNIKPMVLKTFEESTHTTFKIDGEIKLKLFPWPSINATNLTIENPKGFIAPENLNNLAHIKRVKARLKIIDLLRKEIHPTSIFINGVDINLITLMNGKTNWQPKQPTSTTEKKTTALSTTPADSSQSNSNDSPAAQSQPLNMKDMKELPLVQINEASIHIINLKTNRRTDLTNLAMRCPTTQKPEKYKIIVSGEIEHNHPKINLGLHLVAKVDFDFSKLAISFEEIHMMTRWYQIVYKLQHPVSIILFGDFSLKEYNFNADLHGGFAESEGNILIQASKENSLIKGGVEMKNVSIMSAIALLTHKYLTDGVLNAKASFTTKGKDFKEWSNNLSGSGTLNISKGKIKGINLIAITSNAVNRVINPSTKLVEIKENTLTSFSQASADYTLENGLLNFKSFLIDSKKMKIQGSGTIYFPDSTINIDLVTVYDDNPKWSIPISITGHLSSPIIKANTSGITNEFIKTPPEKTSETLFKIAKRLLTHELY